MRPQAYQTPEIRDENDSIIQQGTFGKKTPFVNSQNDGILDYIINNLEAIKGMSLAATIVVSSLPTTGQAGKFYLLDDGTENSGKVYIYKDKWVEVTTQAVGLSAYQIALKNGYEGTEQEWLEDEVYGDGIVSAETDSDGYFIVHTRQGKTIKTALKPLVDAKASADKAKTSETNSANSAATALASQEASEDSQVKAKTSETNAKKSESNAKSSENLAKAWAMSENSPDGITGNKSSKTWAVEAKASASNSASSASSSQSSATASASSASDAKVSETNAAKSATAAAQSAENAKTWDPTRYTKTIQFSKEDNNGNNVLILLEQITNYDTYNYHRCGGSFSIYPYVRAGANHQLAFPPVHCSLSLPYNTSTNDGYIGWTTNATYVPLVVKNNTTNKIYWGISVKGSGHTALIFGAFEHNIYVIDKLLSSSATDTYDGWTVLQTAEIKTLAEKSEVDDVLTKQKGYLALSNIGKKVVEDEGITDLNAVEFLSYPSWYCRFNVTVAKLQNCPTHSAFHLFNFSNSDNNGDLSNLKDNYYDIIQVLIDISGNIWRRCAFNSASTKFNFTAWAKSAVTSDLPTKTSQLTNDSNFATIAQLPDLTVYATKTELENGFTTASLTVSGETSVPTPSTENNSKTIANTEFVHGVVSNLVNGAPTALDTLQELATALGNDPNFSTTILNKIGEKESKTDAQIEHKRLQDAIPTKVSQLSNDSGYQKTAEIPVASQTQNGYMSKYDKAKLDGLSLDSYVLKSDYSKVVLPNGHISINGSELWIE